MKCDLYDIFDIVLEPPLPKDTHTDNALPLDIVLLNCTSAMLPTRLKESVTQVATVDSGD